MRFFASCTARSHHLPSATWKAHNNAQHEHNLCMATDPDRPDFLVQHLVHAVAEDGSKFFVDLRRIMHCL